MTIAGALALKLLERDPRRRSALVSSLRASGQFSIGAFDGIGNGPGSDSSGYW